MRELGGRGGSFDASDGMLCDGRETTSPPIFDGSDDVLMGRRLPAVCLWCEDAKRARNRVYLLRPRPIAKIAPN
jgi:hypothetical protein